MRYLGPVLILALAMPALAQDALPLRRGFYVQEPTPCARASNATLTLFDGRGFNVSQAECRIVRKQQVGNAFDIREDCRDIRSGSPIEGGTERITPTQTGFNRSSGGETTRWRYCPQSQLPSPWRNNRIQ